MSELEGALAVGAALAELRNDRGATQTEVGSKVAELLGRPKPYDQTTVRKWEQEGNLSVEQMLACEEALLAPQGELMRRSGLITDEVSVEQAVRADPALPPTAQDSLIQSYRTMRTLSEQQLNRRRRQANR